MKALTYKSIAVATLMACTSLSHAAPSFTLSGEQLLINICQAAKDNEVSKMKKLIRNTGVSYKKLQRNLRCNGLSLMDFAIENNAENTAIHIAQKAKIDPSTVIARLNDSETEETVSDS